MWNVDLVVRRRLCGVVFPKCDGVKIQERGDERGGGEGPNGVSNNEAKRKRKNERNEKREWRMENGNGKKRESNDVDERD